MSKKQQQQNQKKPFNNKVHNKTSTDENNLQPDIIMGEGVESYRRDQFNSKKNCRLRNPFMNSFTLMTKDYFTLSSNLEDKSYRNKTATQSMLRGSRRSREVALLDIISNLTCEEKVELRKKSTRYIDMRNENVKELVPKSMQ